MERKDARKATSSDKKLGTEIGKQAADKSRGLFSAEDWQCTQCANVNWSRRQSCNMCNAPKFHDVEERTGKLSRRVITRFTIMQPTVLFKELEAATMNG